MVVALGISYSTLSMPHDIGVGSKFEVQRPCCVARSAAKRMEIYFAALRAAANFFKCAPLDCKIKPFFNGV